MTKNNKQIVKGSESSFSQLFAMSNFRLSISGLLGLGPLSEQTQGFENWIYFRHQVGRWGAAKLQILVHIDNDTHFSRSTAEFLCELFIL